MIAPDKVRLRHLAARNREEDPKTLEKMKAKEKLENTAAPAPMQKRMLLFKRPVMAFLLKELFCTLPLRPATNALR